jgi:hypothetical protein
VLLEDEVMAEMQRCFIRVVSAAPQLEIRCDSGPTIAIGQDVVKFEKSLRAAPSL